LDAVDASVEEEASVVVAEEHAPEAAWVAVAWVAVEPVPEAAWEVEVCLHVHQVVWEAPHR
jgi:hypothetical protein